MRSARSPGFSTLLDKSLVAVRWGISQRSIPDFAFKTGSPWPAMVPISTGNYAKFGIKIAHGGRLDPPTPASAIGPPALRCGRTQNGGTHDALEQVFQISLLIRA